ncbi:GDSL esterase/lipase [Frankliniella fusca]|uniref:GDSL esterase/lipase n=1 Tax=Frankliniella fusca TaxID=407009 RepID=A0AAE1LA90_9NEOP|nr:GDSL esterase/lipase [Frankliniella fusca]
MPPDSVDMIHTRNVDEEDAEEEEDVEVAEQEEEDVEEEEDAENEGDKVASQYATDGNSTTVPKFNGYQLIGDSIVSRLTQYCSPPLRAEYNQYLKSKQVGFVVHGQTSCQLARHLHQAKFDWSQSKAAVLIGTNDALKNVPVDDAKKGIKNVLCFLATSAKQVVVMTIPPIPRDSVPERMDKIKELNAYIAEEAADKDNVAVLDIFSKFMLIDESINVDLFEKTFKSGMIDLIHPNQKGVESIENALIEITSKL